MKKTTRAMALMLGLILTASLWLTGCRVESKPDRDTDGETTVTEEGTKEPASPNTEPDEGKDNESAEETEPDTDPLLPTIMTDEEVQNVLEDDMEMTVGTITSKTLVDSEVIQTVIMAMNEQGLSHTMKTAEGTMQILLVGDTGYYTLVYGGVQEAYRIPMNDEQMGEVAVGLQAQIMGGGGEPEDEGYVEAVMSADWKGLRYPDGTEVVAADLGRVLIEYVMGEYVEGMKMIMEITRSAEGLINHMKYAVTIPAEIADGSDHVMTYDMVIDYENPVIEAPSDLSGYVEASYDEIFGDGFPEEMDPEQAIAYGLDPAGDNYVIGAAGSDISLEEQYWFLNAYLEDYEGKSFTIYGLWGETEEGDLYLDVEGMPYWVLLSDGAQAPSVGASVKVTVVLSKLATEYEGEEYWDYFMVISDLELLNNAA